MQITTIHPDAVLEAILAKGMRSQKVHNLKQLHVICTQHYQSQQSRLRDFSLPTIGRICEKHGLFKARILYNAASSDYIELISAWAAFSGPSSVKGPKEPKLLASHEYLMKIEDPAIRILMQSVISERDKLRAQLNLLKSQTKIVINRQPLGATISPGSPGTPVLMVDARLTDSERTSLQKAVSSEFFKSQSMEEGRHGQVTKGGRIIYDIGYTAAIKKILGGR